MEETYRFSAVVQKEGKWYVSWCPELDIASQGETIEEAIENLKKQLNSILKMKMLRSLQPDRFLPQR
jgi:predicted RNase H-like HicB family nuclease